MANVLLVDDEPAVLFMLGEVLSERGHATTTAGAGDEALAKLDDAEVVITDLAMPRMDGMALLRAARERDPDLPVVVLTARGSERAAVEAMKAGAYDYLTKPADVDQVVAVVERAAEARQLRREKRRAEAERAVGVAVVGESPALRRVLDAAARVAGRDVPVLVTGETGTGKELVASLLHAQGARRAGPLVRFNCAAIPHELAEAELFGHAKGAFTGAATARKGFFAQAHGGTLVLDEVGELPLSVQAKLLRAVQSGETQPVGAGRVERVDARVVSCTNRDLAAEARAGRFREDLYYRLSVVELRVPPLRERRGDVPALAAEFTRRYARRFGVEGARLSGDLVAALAAREWPGNVRELENAVARLVALSAGGEIGLADYAACFGAAAAGAAGVATGTEGASAGGPTFKEQMDAFERGLVADALRAAGGNQSEAARRLGITRVTLIDKMKRYGLHPRG